MTQCSGENCSREVRAKDLCEKHYQRMHYQIHRQATVERKRAYVTRRRASDPAWHEACKADYRKWKREPLARYRHSIRMSKSKGLTFTLTQEQYFAIIAQDCYYCEGFFPKVECAIGLDRIDNDKGYEEGNVLSCCNTCNNTRNAHFTVAETKAMIQLVISMRKHEIR